MTVEMTGCRRDVSICLVRVENVPDKLVQFSSTPADSSKFRAKKKGFKNEAQLLNTIKH